MDMEKAHKVMQELKFTLSTEGWKYIMASIAQRRASLLSTLVYAPKKGLNDTLLVSGRVQELDYVLNAFNGVVTSLEASIKEAEEAGKEPTHSIFGEGLDAAKPR